MSAFTRQRKIRFRARCNVAITKTEKDPSVLNAVVVLLILAHIFSQVKKFVVNDGQDYGWTNLFDLDREMNFPTYYSSTMLFMCSVLLGFIASEARRSKRRDLLYWVGLSLIFLFLSVDEYSSLHERLIVPLQSALNVSGPLYFAWIIPYSIAMVVILLVFINFWIRLPPNTRNLLFLGGLLYAGGAIGMEMVGGVLFRSSPGSEGCQLYNHNYHRRNARIIGHSSAYLRPSLPCGTRVQQSSCPTLVPTDGVLLHTERGTDFYFFFPRIPQEELAI